LRDSYAFGLFFKPQEHGIYFWIFFVTDCYLFCCGTARLSDYFSSRRNTVSIFGYFLLPIVTFSVAGQLGFRIIFKPLDDGTFLDIFCYHLLLFRLRGSYDFGLFFKPQYDGTFLDIFCYRLLLFRLRRWVHAGRMLQVPAGSPETELLGFQGVLFIGDFCCPNRSDIHRSLHPLCVRQTG
jgi:hypothetical protein